MKLLGTIVNGRVELDTPTDLPDGTRVVSLEAEEFEDFQQDYPLPQESWEEHIADLRVRIAELDAGVPCMTVDEAFASIREELGWTDSQVGKSP